MNAKNIMFLIVLVAFLALPVQAQVLDLSFVNQDPDPVNAGDVVKVKFKVENKWEDTRDDVRVEIIPAYPFSLFSGEPVEYIGRLDGRQYGDNAVIIDFWIKVEGDAGDGEHPIDVKVRLGEVEYLYKDKFFIDVKNEEIKLRAYIRESDVIVGGTSGGITVELANAGEDDLEFVELEILPVNGYKLLSTSNYVYIGDLDSDDTETEEFVIYVDQETTELNIPVRLSYEVRQEFYAEEKMLHLDFLDTSEAKELGLIKVSYTKHVIIGIVIILIAFYIFRKIRKR